LINYLILSNNEETSLLPESARETETERDLDILLIN